MLSNEVNVGHVGDKEQAVGDFPMSTYPFDEVGGLIFGKRHPDQLGQIMEVYEISILSTRKHFEHFAPCYLRLVIL